MTAHFLKVGNTIRIYPQDSLDLRESLPVGNYTAKFDKQGNFYYLEMVDVFETLPKFYGDTIRHAERILNTFFHRQTGRR